jgi:hypothetical protein
MGIIKIKEIKGYQFFGGTPTETELVCSECISEEEFENIHEHEILEAEDLEQGEMYFCDRCKERI